MCMCSQSVSVFTSEKPLMTCPYFCQHPLHPKGPAHSWCFVLGRTAPLTPYLSRCFLLFCQCQTCLQAQCHTMLVQVVLVTLRLNSVSRTTVLASSGHSQTYANPHKMAPSRQIVSIDNKLYTDRYSTLYDVSRSLNTSSQYIVPPAGIDYMQFVIVIL